MLPMSRQPASTTADLPAQLLRLQHRLQPTNRHPPRNAIPLTPQPAHQPATKHTRADDPRPSSPSDPCPPRPPSPPCRCSPLPPCCPLAPLPRSAPGPTKTSVMWWVEEGGPRVGAKRRGGDPLPQCQAQSQISPASGQQGVRLGCSPYRRTPKRTPRRTPPPQTDTPAGHPHIPVICDRAHHHYAAPLAVTESVKGTTTQPPAPFRGGRRRAWHSHPNRTAPAYRALAVSPHRIARTPAQAAAPRRASRAWRVLAPALWQAGAPILRATHRPCPKALPATPHAPTEKCSPRP